MKLTWYCPRGCNVFQSASYTKKYPPECAACGATMTEESDDFNNALETMEAMSISAFENKQYREM